MQSARSRRVRLVALALAAGASGVLYAQTLNLKPGLYELTSVIDMHLSPEQLQRLGPAAVAVAQPHVSQHCITETDLEHVSQKLGENQPGGDHGCHITERSVTGNEVRFTQQCPGRTNHFEGTFLSDSFTAQMVGTTRQGRQPATVKITGKRIGGCSK